MQLESITVENFRSIIAAKKIPISKLTTLIGPNNEGKSNILRALAIGVNTLVSDRLRRVRRHIYTVSGRRRSRDSIHEYVWEADYPLRLQTSKPAKSSNIILEFSLSEQENEDFHAKVGSRLNGTLPIAIAYRRGGEVRVSVAKQGRGQKVLNAKSDAIAKFLAAKLDLQYIPAVRTASEARDIVDELVARELSKIEEDPRYAQALADIAALQEPILQALSRSIAATMQGFLPQIRNVRLTVAEDGRSRALRSSSEILIDDGAETLLEYKGDGVQSLAALAIMRHASQLGSANRDTIIALEEPESHLHPRAIRELRDVLRDLSQTRQVVLTTHNPLFASRDNIHSNIIVRNNRAFSAISIKDVRDALGVRLEDNLTSAELVLLVEGEEDRIALSSLLRACQGVGELFKQGRVAIDVLGGAGNLTHRARLHSENLCKLLILLDNDKAGQAAFSNAEKENIVARADATFTLCGGKVESELEDLYAEAIYDDILTHEAGSTLPRHGPDKEKKWSDRVRNLLRSAGKLHDDVSIASIKMRVAQSAATAGWSALHPSKAGPIEALCNQIKARCSAS